MLWHILCIFLCIGRYVAYAWHDFYTVEYIPSCPRVIHTSQCVNTLNLDLDSNTDVWPSRKRKQHGLAKAVLLSPTLISERFAFPILP